MVSVALLQKDIDPDDSPDQDSRGVAKVVIVSTKFQQDPSVKIVVPAQLVGELPQKLIGVVHDVYYPD